jgi:hypothetical protein
MKNTHIVLLTLFLGLMGYIAIGYAEVRAEFMLERNARVEAGLHAPVAEPRLAESIKKSIKDLRRPIGLAILAIFLIPGVAMLFLIRTRVVKYGLLCLVIAMTTLDLGPLLSHEGGDIKGCESCFGLVLLHIVFAFVVLLSSFVIGAAVTITQSKRDKNAT